MRDDEWLEVCGKNQWIAFSHDRKFHRIDAEATAIKQHKVAAFCLCGANSPTWDKLCFFVKAYPKLVEIARNEAAPYLYRIHPSSRLERVALP